MNSDESRSYRLVDKTIADEPPSADKPVRIAAHITGYASEPLVSLEEDCESSATLINELPVYITMAKDKSCSPADDLSPDESAAIYLYTMEWTPWQRSFYIILNRTLRDPDRSELTMKPWFKYLKLFLTALAKLPNLSAPNRPQIVYRGLKVSIDNALYAPGSFVIWWAFSSCTNEGRPPTVKSLLT